MHLINWHQSVSMRGCIEIASAAASWNSWGNHRRLFWIVGDSSQVKKKLKIHRQSDPKVIALFINSVETEWTNWADCHHQASRNDRNVARLLSDRVFAPYFWLMTSRVTTRGRILRYVFMLLTTRKKITTNTRTAYYVSFIIQCNTSWSYIHITIHYIRYVF